MSTRLGSKAAASQVEYPDSDGKRMAEYTLEFQWIVTIKERLDALFRDRPDVFVAGDLLWYPSKGTTRPGPRQTHWSPSAGRRATKDRKRSGRKGGSSLRSSSR
nr:hypothetical protein [Tautonia rosea]